MTDDRQGPIEIVGDVARCAICAPPGHRLLVGDFSGIESRVLAWIADEPTKLAQWAKFDRTQDPNDDPYVVIGRSLGHPEATARKFGKIADLAFGYQGGPDAYKNFAPADDTATEAQIQGYKQAWREAHPQVEQFWRGINRAAVAAVTRLGAPITYGRLTLQCERLNDAPFLFITLPSGRRLAYPFVKLIPRNYAGRSYSTVEFMDNSISNGGWTPCNFGNGAYGGLWTENVVQAIARDLLAAAMLRLEAAGYPVVLHVHDEIVCELPDDEGNLDEFKDLITRVPEWAAGLPVAAKVRNGPRFAEVDVPVEHVPGSQEAPPPKQKAKRAPISAKPATPLPLDPEMVARVVAFTIEREAIRLCKEAGQAAPWTDDPILSKGYFCNVHREHDKVTRWITGNWRDPHRDDPDLWFAMTTARCINEPDALAELGYPVPFDGERTRSILEARKARGGKVFRTNAYKPPTPPDENDSTIRFLVEDVLGPLWRDREQLRPQASETLRAYSDRLRERYRIGPFLAGQVIADLKHVEPLRSASDWWSFAVPGPGSLRGLNRVCKREVKASWSEAQWHATLLQLGSEIAPQLEASGIARLDAQNLQNVLCEADKYFRAKEKGGNPSRKYKSAAAPKSTRAKKSSTATKLDVGPQGVPFMITRELRERLARVGFAEEQIKNMLPAEAWEHIRAGKSGSHVEPAGKLPGEQQQTQRESPKFSNISDEGPVSEPKATPEPDAIPAHILDDASAATSPVQAPAKPDVAPSPPPSSPPLKDDTGRKSNGRQSYPHGERDTGTQVDFYIYRDVRGRFYLGVKRTTDKQFPQYRWDGKQWQKGLPKGFLKIPYRLPELLDAPPDAWVVIAAGEKDAETAVRLGFVATTNSGGEGKGQWTPELSRWFAGKQRVAIMEDNDDAGRAHAPEVATALRGIVPDIRIVRFRELATHGDLTDWISAVPGRGHAELLVRIEAAVPAEGELDEWDAGEVLAGALPKPRQWLTAGQFCRTFLSGIVAPGDVGKTTLRLTQAIELAIGRELLGMRVFKRCRVLVLSFEDDRDELHRRLLAICKHHKVKPAELRGWLFCRDLNSGPKLAELDGRGKRRQVGALDGMLRRAIARTSCDLLVLDPFIKLHALNESDNPDMNFVCELLIKLAQDGNIAVDSPAHTHKGAIQAGDADARRGASAQRDAGRLDYTFTVMSEHEAKQFGIAADERKRFMRLDKAKANIVRAVKARWFRLASVRLDNATTLYPDGDEVQAIERWEPPETWDGADGETLNAILDAIDAGLPDGRRYIDHGAAKDRAAWLAVQKHCPDKPEVQCREMIKQWIKAEVLLRDKYFNPLRREQENGLFVDADKRPAY